MTLQERLLALRGNYLGDGVQPPIMRQEIIAELDRLQAKIDALMLEYCPDEMTTEQMQEWERHQKPVKQAQAAEKAMEQKP